MTSIQQIKQKTKEIRDKLIDIDFILDCKEGELDEIKNAQGKALNSIFLACELYQEIEAYIDKEIIDLEKFRYDGSVPF